jgi:3-deoxy-manno-octulosonate cytidylyltransferase (CMP-KDO synthetase)
MKSIIVIPARYGSTRLPGKPLVEIAGISLIERVYECALESRRADKVIITTDDERIRDKAASFGAPVVMTPPDCPSGTDRVCQAISSMDADIVVNLQGDEPQMRGDMIDTLITAVEEEKMGMATLCSFISDPHDYTSPHAVKVVMDKNGSALYFSRAPIPFMQRTVARPIYKHIGVYAFSRDFLEIFVSLPKGSLEECESLEQLRALEAGHRIKVLRVDYDGIGIDTEEDVKRANEMFAAT